MAIDALSAGTSGTTTGFARLADSYETFLALLTTQLKNQDPLSPLDSNQFTQQIVQMTGVEQQLLTNQLLEGLVAQGQGGVGAGVSYIGKQVTAEWPGATLKEGSADWVYELDRAASDVTLEVLDLNGKVVWSGKAENTTAGQHPFEWNGKDMYGQPMAEGSYLLRVTAKAGSGEVIGARGMITGVVTAVEMVDGEPVLSIGGSQAPLDSVRSVRNTA